MLGSLYHRVHQAVVGNRLLDAAASRAKRLTPDFTLTRRVPYAGRLSFGLRRHHWLLGRGCFEGHRRTLGLFAAVIREGDVLFDIGANIGYYARFALAQFPLSQVVAFEPMSANVRLLARNARLARRAGDGRLRVEPIALSDRDESAAELQIDDMSDGSAVLSRISGGAPSEGRAARGLAARTETVASWRLDTLLFGPPAGALHQALPRPDVIKIDTEGAEHLVLAGARRTLGEHRPRLVLAMHGADRAREALQLLAACGYTAAGRVRDHAGGGMRWAVLGPDDAARLADNNCIASADPRDVAIEPPALDLSQCRREI